MEREVYFAECAGKIKIGVSINVEARLSQLRTGAGGPITLVGSVAGDYDLEAALHKKLSAHRIDREWFRDCPDVRAAIQNCINNFPPPTAKEAREKRADRFKAVCKAIWPTYTAEALAEIAGTDRRSGSRWLSGESEPPACVFVAIMSEIVRKPNGVGGVTE